MRTQTVDPEKIIEATIKIAARDGLENLTTKKIAREAGISEGVIFNYFENKLDLMVKSFYKIDFMIDTTLSSVKVNILTLRKAIRKLWFVYFDFLISHPDCTKYYRQFRHSSYYTNEVINGQNKSFSFLVNFAALQNEKTKINTDIFWVFVIETTLNFAVRVVDGQLPGDEKTKEKYYRYIINGISGLFAPCNEYMK